MTKSQAPLWFTIHITCHFKFEESSKDLVVHSKSTHSWKLWLSKFEHGHHMDGWLFCAMLGALTVGEFPWNQILCRLYTPQKSFGWDYKPVAWVYPYRKIKYVCYRSCSSCWALVDYGNTKTPSMHCRLGSMTLLQTAFLRKSNQDFPREKS